MGLRVQCASPLVDLRSEARRTEHSSVACTVGTPRSATAPGRRGSASRSPLGDGGAVGIDTLDASAPTGSDPDTPSFGRGEELPRGGGLPQRASHEVAGARAGRDGPARAQRVTPSSPRRRWCHRVSATRFGRSGRRRERAPGTGSPGEHRASLACKRGEAQRTRRWRKASRSSQPCKLVNDEEETARGDAGAATGEGKALEGVASVRRSRRHARACRGAETR